MEQAITITWLDKGREPQCPPYPAFPNGKDADLSDGAEATCRVDLPYPARRCGLYIVRCAACDQTVALTTAGRPDDVRSLTLACKQRGAKQ